MTSKLLVLKRNESIHIKTLHTLMHINLQLSQMQNMKVEIEFIDEDPFEVRDVIEKDLKKFDRLVIFRYGYMVEVTDDVINLLVKPTDCHCVLFSGVKPTINWDEFTDKTINDSNEPEYQRGLDFSAVPHKKIRDGIYSTIKFTPNIFVMDCKAITKLMKKKNSNNRFPSNLNTLDEFMNSIGARVYVYTKAVVTTSFQHKSVGSISTSTGVKVS